MNQKVDNIFSLSRLQKLFFFLHGSKYDKYPFCISDIEKEFGFKNPQPDIRMFFDELINREILVFHSKERHGYNKYLIDKLKLENLIDDSEIYVKFKKFFLWR